MLCIFLKIVLPDFFCTSLGCKIIRLALIRGPIHIRIACHHITTQVVTQFVTEHKRKAIGSYLRTTRQTAEHVHFPQIICLRGCRVHRFVFPTPMNFEFGLMRFDYRSINFLSLRNNFVEFILANIRFFERRWFQMQLVRRKTIGFPGCVHIGGNRTPQNNTTQHNTPKGHESPCFNELF